MKFTVSPEQKRFFERHQVLELEGLLSANHFEALKNAINKTLALRLNIDESKLSRSSAQQLFSAGRDLWRSHAEVKKMIVSPVLGDLLFELLDTRPIRLAYDQILPSQRTVSSTTAEPTNYADLLRYNTTLEEISSVQGIAGAAVICLEAPYSPLEGWPSVPGNALIVTGKTILHLSHLQQHVGGLYYIVVFAKEKGVYILNSSDPHTHSFKQAGYNPGDRLTEKFNPTVFR